MKRVIGRAVVIGGVVLGLCGPGWGDADRGSGRAGAGVAEPVKAAAPQGTKAGEGDEAFPTPPPMAVEELKEGVQVTELGCMRVALLFARGSEDIEKLVKQRMGDLDFRLFGSRVVEGGRLDAAQFKALDKEREADLVFFVEVRSELKNRFGDFASFAGEGTVQIYSAISNELLITHTARADGERNRDLVAAERSAREKVTIMALTEAVTKCLEKAHKVIVHEVIVKGVRDEQHLLDVMEYLAKPEEIYHARKLSFDPATKTAKIEVLGAPQSVTSWKAYFEKIPGLEPDEQAAPVRFVLHSELRKKRPEWFQE